MIRAIVLDETLVFHSEDENAEARDKLLIRLQHSGLFVGLFLRSGLDSNRASVLDKLGVSKAFVHVRPGEVQRVASQWDFVGGLFVSNETDSYDCAEFIGAGWTVAAASEGQLSSVPFIITKHNVKVPGCNLFVVGHCMKWSREKDLLQRGALPMLSRDISFVPVDLQHPLETQLDNVDVVLNKATDEIVSVSKTPSDSCYDRIKFSEGLRKLESFLSTHTEICIVDPTDRVMPLMDRVATQSLLESLPKNKISAGGTVRPPLSLKVTSFRENELVNKLKSANVNLPTIVKPQIACGASESHTMAIVFEEHGYEGLPVPLPAVIQEYVDHQSTIYKFYVIGSKVFYSTRKSTPDSGVLRSLVVKDAPTIVFDSLKSLPTGEVPKELADTKLDVVAMRATAARLREKLQLTIIGFDVVVQNGTGDHVIVDVNFFPTFKDVPDAEAIPAFWQALRASKTNWSSSPVTVKLSLSNNFA